MLIHRKLVIESLDESNIFFPLYLEKSNTIWGTYTPDFYFQLLAISGYKWRWVFVFILLRCGKSIIFFKKLIFNIYCFLMYLKHINNFDISFCLFLESKIQLPMKHHCQYYPLRIIEKHYQSKINWKWVGAADW